MSIGVGIDEVENPSKEFKDDLREFLDEYDADDEQLRRWSYQVIDYYGEENIARKIRDGDLEGDTP